jgi:predicted RNA-binding Zn-ribbon protein involved in translation (DUF1610 family)
MNGIQRLMTRILPRRWAKDMERESRVWHYRCQVCGLERSVWDAGGIRWKATGNKATAAPCPRCGQLRTHDLFRKP